MTITAPPTVNTHAPPASNMHECTICSSRLKTKKALQNHMEMHLDEKLHACNHCPQVFNQLAGRYRHMLAVHMDKMIYKCETCSDVFEEEKTLIAHRPKHSLYRPTQLYSCSLCYVCFTELNSLKEHQQKYHPSAPSPQKKSDMLPMGEERERAKRKLQDSADETETINKKLNSSYDSKDE